jgi:hypothetical protein
MRVGRNPLTNQMTDGLPDLVMSVITHLPNEMGYHERRMDVIKACLLSMRNGAPKIPVTVWDNGSCSRLTNWLQH